MRIKDEDRTGNMKDQKFLDNLLSMELKIM